PQPTCRHLLPRPTRRSSDLQLWLVDPRPNVASIVKAVHDSFELSEASNTPVMLEVRIRACHVHGRFATRDNVRPSFPLSRALDRSEERRVGIGGNATLTSTV